MTSGALAVHGGAPVRTAPWPRWPRADDATLRSVEEVLTSTRWAVSGPYDGRLSSERRFAGAFAAFNGVRHCTPTSSGTAALTIALQAAGVGLGDDVLVPGLTWVACASAVLHIGARPVLVDCNPRTLAMDPEAARAAATDRTAAILVVHPYCSVADLDAFVALAGALNIPLIEDCAQAHGARWRGRRVGSFGAMGCFSMQQSKLLTAGEGGAVVTNRADLADRLEQLRSDGRRFADAPVLGRLELVEIGDVLGRNVCMSELHASILLDRLQYVDDENAVRRVRAERLDAAIAATPGVTPLEPDARVTECTYYQFVLKLDLPTYGGAPIERIADAVSAELGIAVNPLHVPLDRHPLLSAGRDQLGGGPLPHAEEARRTCLTLVHPMLLADDAAMHDIAEAFTKLHRNRTELATASDSTAAMALSF